jgi:H+/gluconate symporter-like permease
MQAEDLVIHYGVDIIGLNSPDHVPHLGLATNIGTANSANVSQCLQHSRLGLRINASDKTNNTDNTLVLHTLEALLKSAASAHFDNVVHASSLGSQLADGITPVVVSLIVNDVVSTKLLELIGLFG